MFLLNSGMGRPIREANSPITLSFTTSIWSIWGLAVPDLRPIKGLEGIILNKNEKNEVWVGGGKSFWLYFAILCKFEYNRKCRSKNSPLCFFKPFKKRKFILSHLDMSWQYNFLERVCLSFKIQQNFRRFLTFACPNALKQWNFFWPKRSDYIFLDNYFGRLR